MIVAFLQNQWFKNPERVARTYARQGVDKRESHLERRARLNRAFLFYSSLTGKRLRAVFGDLCDEIVWEEASPKVAGFSSGAFPADPEHIREVIQFWKPSLILTFGRIAREGVGSFPECPVATGPHPAARHSTVMKELEQMADVARRFIAEKVAP